MQINNHTNYTIFVQKLSNLSKRKNSIYESICQVLSFCPPYSETRISEKPL